MPVESNTISRTRLLGQAALGGLTWGALEALRIVLAGRLGLGTVGIAALFPLSMGFSVLAAIVPVAVLAQVPKLRRCRGTWAWAMGMTTPSLLALGEAWFTDPPPFQDPFPFQGDPLVFGLACLGVVTVSFALSAAVEKGRNGPRLLMAVVVAFAVLSIWFEAPLRPPVASGSHPNLLLVTLDTTRADRFTPGGPHDLDTPGFEAVAADGVRFASAIAPIPVTGPSHTTLMSGVPPWKHGSLLNGVPVPEQLPMLAEVLHGQGYDCAAFPSAYVLSGGLGFKRGFSVYDDDFGWVKGAQRVLPGRLWELVRRRLDPSHVLERRGDLTVDRAERWIDDQQGPWFAWVHLFDAHGPYQPPPPFDQRFYGGVDPRDPANPSMDAVEGVAPYLIESLEGITDVDWVRAQYDGEVGFDDAQVQRLLTLLEETGQTKDTLVVIVGDHGEGLGEHGEWFNHGDFLYEHDLHVPLAMRMPGRIAQGTVVQEPIELSDVMPTVLDLLEVEVPAGVQGASWLDALGGGEPPRGMARSIAFDREANRARREADPSFKPTFRMMSARDLTERVVLREDEALPAVVQDVTTGEVVPLDIERLPPPPQNGEEEEPAIRDLRDRLLRRQGLVSAAEALLGGTDASQSQVELSAEDRQMLEALGYMD